jgi:hypothetical protein
VPIKTDRWDVERAGYRSQETQRRHHAVAARRASWTDRVPRGLLREPRIDHQDLHGSPLRSGNWLRRPRSIRRWSRAGRLPARLLPPVFYRDRCAGGSESTGAHGLWNRGRAAIHPGEGGKGWHRGLR